MFFPAINHCSPLRQPRKLLALFLPIAFFISLFAYTIYHIEKESRHAQHARNAHEAVSLSVQPITQTILGITRDLRYLSDDHAMQKMLDHPSQENLARVAADWMSFSRHKQIYDKIRWIDEHGMERLRINYAHPRIIRVPASELQNKSKRYFFLDTFSLSTREIYVSPLDLNVERQQIELPYKPTIRVGTPVFDSLGNKRGILLMNYLATDLLTTFKRADRTSGPKGWLLNNEGYWLSGGGEKNFAFMFSRTEETMSQLYPHAWARIHAEASGTFVTREGLWAFNTVLPLVAGQKSTTGSTAILSPSQTRIGNRKYAWKTVYLMPMASYNEGLDSLAWTLGGAALVLQLLFLTGIWRLLQARLTEEDLRANLEKIVASRTQALTQVQEKLSEGDARLTTLMKTLPDFHAHTSKIMF